MQSTVDVFVIAACMRWDEWTYERSGEGAAASGHSGTSSGE